MSYALERRVEALEGKTIEVGDLTYVFERDPQGDLKEALRRNAEGADPAPHLSDDELYARFKEGLESG